MCKKYTQEAKNILNLFLIENKMSIIIEPTKIKQTFYLLIPKNIAELIEINDHTKLKLNMRKSGPKQVLEYEIN